MCSLKKPFENVLPYFNSNEDLSSSKFFKKDIEVLLKNMISSFPMVMRSILDTYTTRELVAAIKEVYSNQG